MSNPKKTRESNSDALLALLALIRNTTADEDFDGRHEAESEILSQVCFAVAHELSAKRWAEILSNVIARKADRDRLSVDYVGSPEYERNYAIGVGAQIEATFGAAHLEKCKDGAKRRTV